MYVINVKFRDVFEVSLGECLDEIGVYVLWSDGAHAKPSYLGEGNLVARIGTHMQDEGKPFHHTKGLAGVAAILAPDRTIVRRKCDAQIVEYTLLWVAEMIGVPPLHNRSKGRFAAVAKRADQHDTIRINVTGRHPLRLGTTLSQAARLTWRWSPSDGEDDWELEFPWRRAAR